ncbi:MAG: hypothetical protein ACC645_14325 [Pirellulales bacterium]
MDESPAIVFAAGALLVTTFSSFGLLVLWICTCRVHWFLRTLAVMTVVSLPLWIPAYEPCVTLTIQAAVIAAGVFAWRRRHAVGQRHCEGDTAAPSTRFRFSFRSTLLWITVVATATAVGVEVPQQGTWGWFVLVLLGVTTGVVTLLAVWLGCGSQRLRIRILSTVMLVTLLAVPLVWCEGTFGIVFGWGWPPEPPDPVDPDLLAILYRLSGEWVWLAILLATTGLSVCGYLLANLAGCGVGCNEQAESRWAARYLASGFPLLLFLGILLLFPVMVGWKLMHPLPVPYATPSEPNGYGDIVAAGEIVKDSPLLNMVIAPSLTAQSAAEIAKYSEAYELCRRGLSRPA